MFDRMQRSLTSQAMPDRSGQIRLALSRGSLIERRLYSVVVELGELLASVSFFRAR